MDKNTYNKPTFYCTVDDIACVLLSSKPIDGRGMWKWLETRNNFREYIRGLFSSDPKLCNIAIDRFNQICAG